jgi:hypothetical protein
MKQQIKRRRPDGSTEELFPRRTVCGLPITEMTAEEKDLLRKIASYCSKTAREAEGTDDADLVGFAMQIIKKRALSSRAAFAKTLDHRLDALRKEELRAELASVFMMAERGVPHNPNSHAAYLGSWLKALQDNKHEIFRAARDAHKAADLLIALEHHKSLDQALAHINKPPIEQQPTHAVVQVIHSRTEGQGFEMDI